MKSQTDALDWAAIVREHLSKDESQPPWPSARDLLNDMEYLSEGVYVTSDGPIELSRTVH